MKGKIRVMKDELYMLYRIAAIPEYKESDVLDKIVQISGISRRSVKAVIKIINNEPGITKEDIDRICDREFYTRSNMEEAAKMGLYDIIPEKFFEDEIFLKKTGIDFIPDHMASGNRGLKSFTICKQIKRIGDGAFDGCTNLKNIDFEESRLASIGDNAFRDAKKLRLDTIPETVTHIGRGAFENCFGITQFKIPTSVSRIEERTFCRCLGMKEVTFGNLTIGKEAFCDCVNLKSVNGQIHELEQGAFKGCISVEEFNLHAKKIPAEAFAGCIGLKRVNFQKIPDRFEGGCFKGTDTIEQVLASGFSYQLREADGFQELVHGINFKTGIPTKDVFLYKKSVHLFMKNTK